MEQTIDLCAREKFWGKLTVISDVENTRRSISILGDGLLLSLELGSVDVDLEGGRLWPGSYDRERMQKHCWNEEKMADGLHSLMACANLLVVCSCLNSVEIQLRLV